MARHQGGLSKCVARLKLSEKLSSAAVAQDCGRHRAAQHHPEVRGFRTLMADGFIGLKRADARSIDQLLQVFVGKTFEHCCLLFEKVARALLLSTHNSCLRHMSVPE